MQIKDLVYSLKYELDTELLIKKTTDHILKTKIIPSDTECLIMIAVLAVNDEKNKVPPQSINQLYQKIYEISSKI